MLKKNKGFQRKSVINGDACFRAAHPRLLYLPGHCPRCLQQKPCGCGCTPCPPTTCLPNPCLPCQECSPGSYVVTFDTNGGAPVPSPQTVFYRGKVKRPDDPARIGYLFEGWYQTPDFSGNPWDFDADVVTESMTLYARWTPVIYLIAFDADGGVPVPASQSVPYGGKLIRPADPVKEGYIFLGWSRVSGLSNALWDFDADIVTGNMVLRAQWELMQFTVAFDTNGGVPVPQSQGVPYGQKASRPIDPIREDFVFIAWYPTPALTGNPWSFTADVVMKNMTLYARWLEPA